MPRNPSDVICACLGIYVLFIIIVLRRNGLLDAHAWESYFDGVGLCPFSGAIQMYAITFSCSSRRQKAELAEFVGGLKEVERLVQRYEYLTGTRDTLKLESNGHAFNERQKCLLAGATKELESLP
ncbi:hypothetical protein PHISP_08040 [Aspergillus sp. HF37]|nr:hypothetical protein PHISP_08040 [Aspergillus sp. HF37]